ncbi:tyrosine-type recombinase/integrase [Allorhizobium undicola]|uniref:tyrosine-type recombinase/integrase n=1 Tax=Allorhizobium undicola TaxID=78527 RepID=UPI000A44C187|nr:tyrosine-type recombinase/integrase [Allorhizobium undicola]
MDAMPRRPFLSHEVTRHGRRVWYFKRNGKRTRMPDEYGTPEFNAAYEAALSGTAARPAPAKPQSGTLKWLVEQYKRSAVFAALAPSTRIMRDNILKQALADPKTANAQFINVERSHIKKGMDKRAATPNAANNFLKTMSHLFRWAVEAGHLDVNPVLGVSKISVKTDGFHTWTVGHVEQFRAYHQSGTRARLAIDIMLFLGLRRSDAVRVGRQHMKDGVISIKTQKTGEWVYLPVFRQLQESIDAAPTGDLAFLTTERGQPFASAASFGNWFAKQCKAAGLPDECRAHGLRKAGATIAADEGATAHELMAMFGWARLDMAEMYTREADKKRLAKGASERLANRL